MRIPAQYHLAPQSRVSTPTHVHHCMITRSDIHILHIIRITGFIATLHPTQPELLGSRIRGIAHPNHRTAVSQLILGLSDPTDPLSRSVRHLRTPNRLYLNSHLAGPLIRTQCIQIAALLQIADQHDFPGRHYRRVAGILPANRRGTGILPVYSANSRRPTNNIVLFNRFTGRYHGSAQVRPSPARFQLLDPVHHGRPSHPHIHPAPGIESHKRSRLAVETHHTDTIGRSCIPNDLSHLGDRLLPQPGSSHRSARVQQHHHPFRTVRRPLFHWFGKERPRKSRCNQTDHQTSQD